MFGRLAFNSMARGAFQSMKFGKNSMLASAPKMSYSSVA